MNANTACLHTFSCYKYTGCSTFLLLFAQWHTGGPPSQQSCLNLGSLLALALCLHMCLIDRCPGDTLTSVLDMQNDSDSDCVVQFRGQFPVRDLKAQVVDILDPL